MPLVYENDGWNVFRQQYQMLKAVTSGKLLTLNVLGQYLSLLKTLNFQRKQTSLAFDSQHKCVEQALLFQMTSRKHQSFSEISKYFTFLNLKKSLIFELAIHLLSNLSGH